MKLSLVIPVKNESSSLHELFDSIRRQTHQPDEIVVVDGGSTDDTLAIGEQLASSDPRVKFIKTPKASPGKGRNIGAEASRNEWIAFADAGLILADDWLEKLVERVVSDPSVEMVYGNYAPVADTFFAKLATIAYVPAQRPSVIRGKSITSSLIKKRVWEAVGGFPDFRAAEDLMFMDAAEKQGFRCAFAPDAKIFWHLRPDWGSTFRKFVLYSKHNVWAGRAWDWHYGLAKQYLFVLPFIVLAIFHSAWWLIGALMWLAARTAKRILPHLYEFGLKVFFNPAMFVGVALLVLTIDAATFIGWAQATLKKAKQ